MPRNSQHRIAAVVGTVALVAVQLVGAAGSAHAAAAAAPDRGCAAARLVAPLRPALAHLGSRVLSAAPTAAAFCTAAGKRHSDFAIGNPPLLFHHGQVMRPATGTKQIVITPIFWQPAGGPHYQFSPDYTGLITRYLHDVQAASGQHDNVFATNTEYRGTNGFVRYAINADNPILDTDPLPPSGCPVNRGPIYDDNSHYTACLDDAQITGEIRGVTRGLPHDLGHLYVMFTPKHVESCFDPAGQQCTLNGSPNAAYCAYHSSFGPGSNSIYAEMPFPIYDSPVGSTCSSAGNPEIRTTQSPNDNPDADVEISPLSHEISEAITDPNGGGWFDRDNFENGDECAYVYGPLQGPAGAQFNQTINKHNYLTQEEFSNADYRATGRGCVASLTPTITSVTASAGPTTRTTHVTITGLDLADADTVTFGGDAAPSFAVLNSRTMTAVAPEHAAGRVPVVIGTPDGSTNAGHFTYVAQPVVSRISPKSGLRAGGTLVTVTGRNFVRGATVLFGSKAASSVRFVAPTGLTVRAPRHVRGTFDVTVRDAGGRSVPRAQARFTVR